MSDETGLAVDALDLGDFGQDVEPATFAPLAAAFAGELAPFHQVLDAAHGALLAETVLELFPGGGDELPSSASVSAASAETPLPLDDLLAAQSGFEDVRQDLAIFAATFPVGYVPGSTIVDRTNPVPGNRVPGGGRVHPR